MNLRLADRVGDVVDNASDTTRVDQFAKDLSGKYGDYPYPIELHRHEVEGEDTTGVTLVGSILDGGTEIGIIAWVFYRDAQGKLVADLGLAEIYDKYKHLRGRGLYKALFAEMEPYFFVRSEGARIELWSGDEVGTLAAARMGFTWNRDEGKLQVSLDSIRRSVDKLRADNTVSPGAEDLLRSYKERLQPGRADLPEPIELTELGTEIGEPDLGRRLLRNTNAHLVKYARGGEADDSTIDTSGQPGGPARGSLDDTAGRLAAADEIGDVRGHPGDPGFQRQQQEYRAQDRTTRRVDTRYAEPLGDVLDNASDTARVDQLAEDLSGSYGPYRIQLTGGEDDRGVFLVGEILSGETEIGKIVRRFFRDDERHLVVKNSYLEIVDSRFQRQGFSTALAAELEPYYLRCGVDRIEIQASRQGSYAWAHRGFTWDLDPARLQESLVSIRKSARQLTSWVSDEAQVVLAEIVGRLEPDHPQLPEPLELADLATPDEPNLGRRLLAGTIVHLVKYLRGPGVGASVQSAGGVEALPEDSRRQPVPQDPRGEIAAVLRQLARLYQADPDRLLDPERFEAELQRTRMVTAGSRWRLPTAE